MPEMMKDIWQIHTIIKSITYSMAEKLCFLICLYEDLYTLYDYIITISREKKIIKQCIIYWKFFDTMIFINATMGQI